jgi:hypothetical protein
MRSRARLCARRRSIGRAGSVTGSAVVIGSPLLACRRRHRLRFARQTTQITQSCNPCGHRRCRFGMSESRFSRVILKERFGVMRWDAGDHRRAEASPGLLDRLADHNTVGGRRIEYSVGHAFPKGLVPRRRVTLERVWTRPSTRKGCARQRSVAELAELLDLSGWPYGMACHRAGLRSAVEGTAALEVNVVRAHDITTNRSVHPPPNSLALTQC